MSWTGENNYDKGFRNGKTYAEQNIGRSMDQAYNEGYEKANQDAAKKVIDLSIELLVNQKANK